MLHPSPYAHQSISCIDRPQAQRNSWQFSWTESVKVFDSAPAGTAESDQSNQDEQAYYRSVTEAPPG
jgi:hypothetical protein